MLDKQSLGGSSVFAWSLLVIVLLFWMVDRYRLKRELKAEQSLLTEVEEKVTMLKSQAEMQKDFIHRLEDYVQRLEEEGVRVIEVMETDESEPPDLFDETQDDGRGIEGQ